MEVVGSDGVVKKVLVKCSMDDIIENLKKLGFIGTSFFLSDDFEGSGVSGRLCLWSL